MTSTVHVWGPEHDQSFKRVKQEITAIFNNIVLVNLLSLVVTVVNIREIKARAFLRRGRQPEENSLLARTVLPPRFLYYLSLMEKRYLGM